MIGIGRVAGRDIQTRQVSVHPRHDERPDGPPVVRGYAMSNLVEAGIRDIDRAGEILQVALQAGGVPPPQPLEELARAGVAAAPVPLAPGEEEVAVHVTARWALR